jgi:predicted RNA-binding Zn-ribbon protein involved in translation (DUF1610 family)
VSQTSGVPGTRSAIPAVEPKVETAGIEPAQRSRQPNIVCATGKRIYFKERSANKAITEALKRGELSQLRHYACPVCGYWHLSRKDRHVHRLDERLTSPWPQFYYACPDCGWCGPIRLTGTSARWDGVRHLAAKANGC